MERNCNSLCFIVEFITSLTFLMYIWKSWTNVRIAGIYLS